MRVNVFPPRSEAWNHRRFFSSFPFIGYSSVADSNPNQASRNLMRTQRASFAARLPPLSFLFPCSASPGSSRDSLLHFRPVGKTPCFLSNRCSLPKFNKQFSRRDPQVSTSFPPFRLIIFRVLFACSISLGSTLDTLRRSHRVAQSEEERQLLDWHMANLEYANAGLLHDLSLAFWDQVGDPPSNSRISIR